MEQNIRIRRLRSLLYTSGQGVLIFSVWNVVRFVLRVFLNDNEWSAGGDTLNVVAMVVTVIMLAVGFLFYAKIGLDAMAVGRGKKRKNTYIVMAFISLILSVALWVLSIVMFGVAEWDISSVAMLLLDLAANIIMAELIVFSLRLKKEEA